MFCRRMAMLTKLTHSIPYSITYNLNGGVLPSENPSTYTIDTSEFVLNSPTRDGYAFLGWTMNDETDYVFGSDFGGCGDRIYTARWNMNITSDDVTNNVLNLTIEASNDANGDGIVDNYNISFAGSGNMEKINLPINNLIVGQKYKLVFTESNNASAGVSEGYSGGIYGCYISSDKVTSLGTVFKEEARSQGGLIAENTGSISSFSLKVIDGNSFNGPRTVSVEFTATASTMYWCWDYGIVQDGVVYTYNYTNIKLNLVAPSIKFSSMFLKDDATYVATYKVNNYDNYNVNFTFDGESGAEFLYYPITGLTSGTTYIIVFNHKFQGAFINGDNGTYDYGCGILADISNASTANKMSGITSSWLSNTWAMNVVSDGTETGTLTFTATGSTAYWIWNMANVSDSHIATVDIEVTSFKASHKNGGTAIYK